MKGIQLMFAKECELSGAKQKSPRLNCREVNAMTFDELRYIEFNKKKGVCSLTTNGFTFD